MPDLLIVDGMIIDRMIPGGPLHYLHLRPNPNVVPARVAREEAGRAATPSAVA